MIVHEHGLLIGKFYPPHHGHHTTIRIAGARCEQVTVVVMASAAESIALAERMRWLRAEHANEPTVDVVGVRCDAPLDLTDERVWAAQVAAIRGAIRMSTARPIDAVFSADDYGSELARWFDATFVPVARPSTDTSATAVRADLAGQWHNLAAATRAGLATRVILVGAESTGTTTLSRQLADHYRRQGGPWESTKWVAEYGREYTEIKWAEARAAARASGQTEPELDDLVWTHDDFDQVAHEQTKREERAAAETSPLLVCDTDAFATAVWERRYLGDQARTKPSWADAPALPRRDVYLLTDHVGVPWHDDGLREGDLPVRAEMTQWFADALTVGEHSWVLLTGTEVQRRDLAIRTVDQLLTLRMRFSAPLTGPGFER